MNPLFLLLELFREFIRGTRAELFWVWSVGLAITLSTALVLIFLPIEINSVLWIVVSLGGSILIFTALVFLQPRTRRQAESLLRQRKGRQSEVQGVLLNVLEQLATNVADGRVSLLIVNDDAHPPHLFMMSSYGEYSQGERALRWVAREGILGRAWYSRQQIFADLSVNSEDILVRELLLSPEKLPYVRNLKAMMAVPIFDYANHEEVLGVLVLDSTEPPEASGLLSSDLINLIDSSVEIISGVLRLTPSAPRLE